MKLTSNPRADSRPAPAVAKQPRSISAARSDDPPFTLGRLIARIAIDVHLSPADLMRLPRHMLELVIDEWRRACERAARTRTI